jgi:hypothetical protein
MTDLEFYFVFYIALRFNDLRIGFDDNQGFQPSFVAFINLEPRYRV